MKKYSPRSSFVIVEDYFTPRQAAQWLALILQKGRDPIRGFHHPHVKANRFHQNPKYPVKKYMCLGLYWDPRDYHYYPIIPDFNVRPYPIPPELHELCLEILKEYYPTPGFSPEGVLVNYYTDDSSMGLHIDKDEEAQDSPVVGINFGSTCRFFFEDEVGEMKETKIPGNSVYIFGGSARSMKHGVGTIYSGTLSAGSENYLENKERVNLTIRQIYKAPE